MPQQQKIIFSQNPITTLHIHNSPTDESRTDSLTMKCTSTEKEVLRELARSDGAAASEYMRAAIGFYLSFREEAAKMVKYKEAVLNMVKHLP